MRGLVLCVLLASCDCGGVNGGSCDEVCTHVGALCTDWTIGECMGRCERDFNGRERACLLESSSCATVTSFCLDEGYCGDGFRDRGEECDDANDIDGDGCTSTCMAELRDVGIDVFDSGIDGAIDSPCPFGESYCDETCIPSQTDPMNCGGCDVVCMSEQSCLAGRCLADRVLEFVLTWDTPGDIDLHVVRPDGEEIWFGRKVPPVGPDGLDGDLDVDDITGRGPERVGFDMPIAGDYVVCINPYGISSPTDWSFDVRNAGVVEMTVTGTETETVNPFTCTPEEAELTYTYAP